MNKFKRKIVVLFVVGVDMCKTIVIIPFLREKWNGKS